MSDPPMRGSEDRLGLLLGAVAAALSALGLLTLALTIAGRVLFPWSLEWMEGGSLQHALRILHGEPLYAPPSAPFIPYLYPPLAYLPMALFAALLGPSLSSARLASVLCTLGSLVLVGRAGARAASHRLGGLIAAGLFAMGFGYCGAFLDLARVDACFVVLLLAAAERLQAERPRQALCWLALCAFAKQHGLLLFLAVCLALLLSERRRHLGAVITASACVLLAYLILELSTAGWFGRYALALPMSHAFGRRLFVSYFLVDVLAYLPVLTLFVAIDASRLIRRARKPSAFDALLCAALVASALGRAHTGGWDNVRLPGFALLCVASAAPLCRWMLGQEARPATRMLACAALGLQLAMLWQAPSFHQPRPDSGPAFAELRATLQRCADGGSAVALDYAGLTAEPFLHTMALSDLRTGRNSALANAGTNALLAALRSQRAPAAIAVGERFPALQHVLAERYHECARVPAPKPATGYRPGVLLEGHLLQIVYAKNSPARVVDDHAKR